MPWWIELAAYLLGSLSLAWITAGVFSVPYVADIWERHVVPPLTAVLILCAVSAFLDDPHLHTLSGLATFLHNDTGY